MATEKNVFRRSRLIFKCCSGNKTLLWVDQGKDKSIYLGIGDPDDPALTEFSDIESINSIIKYDSFINFSKIKFPKVSYHPKEPSIHLRGINSMGNKTKPIKIASFEAIPLADNKFRRLCLLVFPPASSFPASIRNFDKTRDILLDAPHLENKPLAGDIVASSLNSDISVLQTFYPTLKILASFRSKYCQLSTVLYSPNIIEKNPPYPILGIPTRVVNIN